VLSAQEYWATFTPSGPTFSPEPTLLRPLEIGLLHASTRTPFPLPRPGRDNGREHWFAPCIGREPGRGDAREVDREGPNALPASAAAFFAGDVGGGNTTSLMAK